MFSMAPGGGGLEGRLYTVPAQGGTPQLFLEPDSTLGETGLTFPHVLPDGRSFLMAVPLGDSIGTIVLHNDNTHTTLIRHTGENLAYPVYAPSGHIVYQRGWAPVTGVWAVGFDLASGAVTGQPFLVADGQGIPSVSSDGTLLYSTARQGATLRQLAWVDRDGTVKSTIARPLSGMSGPHLSPNDRQVAVTANEQGNYDIWTQDVIRGTNTRLTFDTAPDFVPVWSPRGDTLAFSSNRNGPTDIYLRASDGTGSAQPLVTGSGSKRATHWSADGQSLVYHAAGGGGLWYVPMNGTRTPVQFYKTSFNDIFPSLSPDGRYVTFQSDESVQREIYVTRFPSGEGKWQISDNGGYNARWSRSGDEIFYLEPAESSGSGSKLMAVPVETNPSFLPGTPEPLFTTVQVQASGIRGYDASADGQRFVVVQEFSDGEDSARVMTVVENWARGFDGR